MTLLRRNQFSPLLLAVMPLMSVGSAQAANLQTFNFNGTLATSFNGQTSVTGQFTIDFTTPQITAFHFDTPLATISAPTWTPTLIEVAATNPNATFTVLSLGTTPGDRLTLWFESPLSAFSGSSFYTGPVTLPTGAGASQLFCSTIATLPGSGCTA